MKRLNLAFFPFFSGYLLASGQSPAKEEKVMVDLTTRQAPPTSTAEI